MKSNLDNKFSTFQSISVHILRAELKAGDSDSVLHSGCTGALGAAVGGTIALLRDKDDIKKRDEEIGEERKREREIEIEKEENRPLEVGMMHHHHAHPLNEVDAKEKQFVCGGCNRTGRGRRYSCQNADCNFQMHRVCTSSPVMLVAYLRPDAAAVQTLDTFAHSGHLVKEVYKHAEKYDCRKRIDLPILRESDLGRVTADPYLIFRPSF